jgi:hypothetical protein
MKKRVYICPCCRYRFQPDELKVIGGGERIGRHPTFDHSKAFKYSFEDYETTSNPTPDIEQPVYGDLTSTLSNVPPLKLRVQRRQSVDNVKCPKPILARSFASSNGTPPTPPNTPDEIDLDEAYRLADQPKQPICRKKECVVNDSNDHGQCIDDTLSEEEVEDVKDLDGLTIGGDELDDFVSSTFGSTSTYEATTTVIPGKVECRHCNQRGVAMLQSDLKLVEIKVTINKAFSWWKVLVPLHIVLFCLVYFSFVKASEDLRLFKTWPVDRFLRNFFNSIFPRTSFWHEYAWCITQACVFTSLASFLASVLIDTTTKQFKYVTYCPHLLAGILADFDRSISPEIVRANIRSKLRRQACIPLPDLALIPVWSGTEVIAEFLLLQTKDYFFVTGVLTKLGPSSFEGVVDLKLT